MMRKTIIDIKAPAKAKILTEKLIAIATKAAMDAAKGKGSENSPIKRSYA